MTCPSQGKQPCICDLTCDFRQYQSYLTDLRTVPSLDFKRRAFIKSSKVIDLEEQDLIPLTSVVSKGFKVPLDVGVSPFIIPGCKSFLTNFDTPMGSTPQCKPASLCGYLSTTSIHLGCISYTCSDGMEYHLAYCLEVNFNPCKPDFTHDSIDHIDIYHNWADTPSPLTSSLQH